MLLSLRPALLRARRGAGRLQLGLTPDRGVVLTGLDEADERLLALLDTGVDEGALAERAAELGVPGARAHHLVASLRAAGVLVDRPAATGAPGSPRGRPPRRSPGEQRALVPDARVLALVHPGGDGWAVLGRRWRSCVRVAGASRTGLAVALGVASAGVGRVLVDDPSPVGPDDVSPGGYRVEDVGHPRAERATALVRAQCPLVLTAPPASATHPAHPDVVVLVAAGAVDAARGDALVAESVPHLPVLWREGTAVVGPLVRPGTSACLRCLDHHRADRDPEWPAVSAQLTGAVPGARGRPEETSLAALTASLAVVQVLAQLDGAADPASLGAALEASLPDGRVVQRPWVPHPRCGCTWRGGRLGG